jgi:hypothetical protein
MFFEKKNQDRFWMLRIPKRQESKKKYIPPHIFIEKSASKKQTFFPSRENKIHHIPRDFGQTRFSIKPGVLTFSKPPQNGQNRCICIPLVYRKRIIHLIVGFG